MLRHILSRHKTHGFSWLLPSLIGVSLFFLVPDGSVMHLGYGTDNGNLIEIWDGSSFTVYPVELASNDFFDEVITSASEDSYAFAANDTAVYILNEDGTSLKTLNFLDSNISQYNYFIYVRYMSIFYEKG